MTASKLKGNLLEYFVYRLLSNCGFKNVSADGLYIYNSRGLRFINGKGSSHDADVLMSPPIQMPFALPYRLLFECKAYSGAVGLPIVRNALGLRYDINEFEVVTTSHLRARKNIRRRCLAIHNRPRYLYQVGVASINGFTKPAIEFSTNNKIPMLSLDWILPPQIISLYDQINDTLVDNIDQRQLDEIEKFLKHDISYSDRYLRNGNAILSSIYNNFLEFENRVLIGLLETGDLIFLTTNNEDSIDYLLRNYHPLSARYYYEKANKERWELRIEEFVFKFYLPIELQELWKKYDFDYKSGLNIKGSLFNKIFVFMKDERMPFRIITIDRLWLENISSD